MGDDRRDGGDACALRGRHACRAFGSSSSYHAYYGFRCARALSRARAHAHRLFAWTFCARRAALHAHPTYVTRLPSYLIPHLPFARTDILLFLYLPRNIFCIFYHHTVEDCAQTRAPVCARAAARARAWDYTVANLHLPSLSGRVMRFLLLSHTWRAQAFFAARAARAVVLFYLPPIP